MSGKKWIGIFFSIIIVLTLILSMIIIIVDPYFHYHKPLSFLNYKLNDERYSNNGIIKRFNYDAMIIGTSLDENFKNSEFDNLFNCNSIKVTIAGAGLKEIADQTKFAIEYNPSIKQILYGIKYANLLPNEDDEDEGEDIQDLKYLYDDNLLNDCKYIFNGQALRRAGEDILYTIMGKQTGFDEYANWNDLYVFSKEKALGTYNRQENKVENTNLSEDEKNRVLENINQNIIDIVKKNENITVYLFLAPHNIIWWDYVSQRGETLKYFEAEEMLIDMLLECNNVKLYSFFNNTELICNLDKYIDEEHYSEDINSQILKWIKEDEYLITKENKDEYLKQEREFYLNYNYDSIFENSK